MTTHIQFSPGDYLAPAVDWLNTNLHGLFKGISQVIEAVLGAVEGALLAPHPYLFIGIVVVAAFFFANKRVAVFLSLIHI